MVLMDFEYNGELLSSYDCIIGFLSSTPDKSVLMQSPLNLNTVKNKDINMITSIDYNDVLSAEFTIVKNPCNNLNFSFITDYEIEQIVKWLNQKGYNKFKPIYDDGSFSDVYFMGTFTNINLEMINGQPAGLSLVFTSNAPYGFADEMCEIFNTSTITKTDDFGKTFNIYNNSQELGYLYPNKVVITCKSAGNIYLRNTTDNNYTSVIKNCTANEIITLDCINKVISTNKTHSTLYNDFNYNFPRLITKYNEMENIYSFNTSQMNNAIIEFYYSPIRKVGIII